MKNTTNLTPDDAETLALEASRQTPLGVSSSIAIGVHVEAQGNTVYASRRDASGFACYIRKSPNVWIPGDMRSIWAQK